MAIGTITRLGGAQGHQESLGTTAISFPGDAAYPTGGTADFEDSVREALKMGTVELVGVAALNAGGYLVGYDKPNDKLKVYRFDYAAVAAGPAVEVPNGTDLSGVTFSLSVTTI